MAYMRSGEIIPLVYVLVYVPGVITAGLFAGFVNTLQAAFTYLPSSPDVPWPAGQWANGTNRIGVLVQSLVTASASEAELYTLMKDVDVGSCRCRRIDGS
jgi:hypothetical protein